MQIIETYHTTLHDPECFVDGFWPLTHFGPAEIGLRQVARHFSWCKKSGAAAPRTVWVIPVTLRYETISVLPDWKTSRFLGLANELKKQNVISVDERRKWRGRCDATCDEEGRPDVTALRTLRDDFAVRLRELEYDLLSYETVAERDAYELFSYLQLGGQCSDFICYSTTSLEQVSIRKAPIGLDTNHLSSASERR